MLQQQAMPLSRILHFGNSNEILFNKIFEFRGLALPQVLSWFSINKRLSVYIAPSFSIWPFSYVALIENLNDRE